MRHDNSRYSAAAAYAAALAGLEPIAEYHAGNFSRLKISSCYGPLTKSRGYYIPFTGWYHSYSDKTGPISMSDDCIAALFALLESLHKNISRIRINPEFNLVQTPLGTDIPFEAYYYVSNEDASGWIVPTVTGS